MRKWTQKLTGRWILTANQNRECMKDGRARQGNPMTSPNSQFSRKGEPAVLPIWWMSIYFWLQHKAMSENKSVKTIVFHSPFSGSRAFDGLLTSCFSVAWSLSLDMNLPAGSWRAKHNGSELSYFIQTACTHAVNQVCAHGVFANSRAPNQRTCFLSFFPSG